jgi:hypothetical protein
MRRKIHTRRGDEFADCRLQSRLRKHNIGRAFQECIYSRDRSNSGTSVCGISLL